MLLVLLGLGVVTTRAWRERRQTKPLPRAGKTRPVQPPARVPAAPAATFTVTNTNDGGAGSLRQALNDANATPELDRIIFTISGSGVQTINPASALPQITRPVMLDGYTQPGASRNTQAVGNNAVINIRINGTGAGATANATVRSAGFLSSGLVARACL
jgi:hypothetical protein